MNKKQEKSNIANKTKTDLTDIKEKIKKFEQFEKVLNQAKEIVELLKQHKLFITVAESCTGGGLMNFLTNISGSGEVFRGGLVTYSNEEKIIHGVPKKIIDEFTVYSTEVAEILAEVAIKISSKADIGVGITGSFSRVDPFNPNSKPGEVYISVKTRDKTISQKFTFADTGARFESKNVVISEAFEMINEMICKMN